MMMIMMHKKYEQKNGKGIERGWGEREIMKMREANIGQETESAREIE